MSPDDYDFDHGARTSYERFLHAQPQVRVTGLWRLGHEYFIVCPDLQDTSTSAEGEPLTKWFDDRCRIICSPVRLVATPPSGSVPAEERSFHEIVENRSGFRTISDADRDLRFALPKEFPDFQVQDENDGNVYLTVCRDLTHEEVEILESTWNRLGLATSRIVRIRPEMLESAVPPPTREPVLVSSRWIPKQFSRHARSLVEEDEDFWVSQRRTVLDGVTSPESLGTSGSGGAKCFVDATGVPGANLRSYFVLYDRVALALPTEERIDANLAEMQATRRDIVELAAAGRLQIVLPLSMHRYEAAFISELAEKAPSQLTLSRRLAAAAIADSKSRFPTLYPSASARERYELLHALHYAASAADPAEGHMLAGLARGLTRAWEDAEQDIHDYGAPYTGLHGIAPVAAAILREVRGIDVGYLLTAGANLVEWSCALGADLCPPPGESEGSLALLDYISGLFARSPRPCTVVDSRTVTLSSELVALNNDFPVAEVARWAGSGDVQRFRELVQRLINTTADQEELRAAIDKLNSAVRTFERRPDRLTRWNIVGFAGALVSSATQFAHTHPLTPVGFVLLGFLLTLTNESFAAKSRWIGSVHDALNAGAAGLGKDAALLVRMRKRTK